MATTRDSSGGNPGDMPWNDVPADDDVTPGTEEPDPAEVGGTEDDDAQFDAAAHQTPDPAAKYVRESLDQRLTEEEPDRPERRPAEGVGVIDADGDDEAGRAEPDDDDPGTDDLAAEEAALHVTDEP